jgi:hypothetical protein
MDNLARIAASRKTGAEPFIADGRPTGMTLADFWAWSRSDLLDNTERGVLAEFIVAAAVGIPTAGVREGWAAWDLTTTDGVRIEVKSAAYLQITLANEVFHRLAQSGAQHDMATHLVASAAFQVGFARIATGMARWSRESSGHTEMQGRLSDEQFDVLMLAPVDSAARTAMTCMDLCAAASYRLSGAARTGGWESDVQDLLQRINRGTLTLAASQDVWLHALDRSPDWQLLKKARTAVTHRAISGLSALGSGPPVTSLVIDGQPHDNVDLSRRFAELAETYFENFTAAVLSDLP